MQVHVYLTCCNVFSVHWINNKNSVKYLQKLKFFSLLNYLCQHHFLDL